MTRNRLELLCHSRGFRLVTVAEQSGEPRVWCSIAPDDVRSEHEAFEQDRLHEDIQHHRPLGVAYEVRFVPRDTKDEP